MKKKRFLVKIRQYICTHEDQVVRILTIMTVTGFIAMELLLIGFHYFNAAYAMMWLPILIVSISNMSYAIIDKDWGQLLLSVIAAGCAAFLAYIIIVLLLPFYV